MKECVQGHTANKWQSQNRSLSSKPMLCTTLLQFIKYILQVFLMKNYYNQFPDSLLNWKMDMSDHFSKVNVRSSILLPLTLLPICGNLCIPCGYGWYQFLNEYITVGNQHREVVLLWYRLWSQTQV